MSDTLWIKGLPYPPSENAIYSDRVFRNKAGHLVASRFLNSLGTKYKSSVSAILNQTGVTTPLREFIELHDTVDIMVYLGRPNWYTVKGTVSQTAGDTPSPIKILQDIIFETIGINDAHAFFTGSRKVYAKEPSIIVVFSKPPESEDYFG